MNVSEIERMARSGRKQVLYAPAAEHGVSLGRGAIERLLPHRDPFLLVDGIDAVDLSGATIAGRRHVAPDDPVFRGHFPDDPIYPGVLQVEAMAQVGLCLFGLLKTGLADPDAAAQGVRAIKIHHAAFFAPVRPADELTITAKVLEANGVTGIAAGQITRGGTICSFAVSEVYFVAP